MEIKGFNNAISAYKSNNNYEKVAKNTSATKSTKNIDTVEFSASATSDSVLKAQVATSVNENASAGKIAMLKEKIASGQYNIPAENIAQSILGKY